MDHLELSAHMTVRAGCLEGFKRQAAELIRITKEKDTQTLFRDYADSHFMTVYGDPSQPLIDLVHAHAVGFTLRGLDASPVIPTMVGRNQ